MRILLDTHLLLWVVGDSKRLPQAARSTLEAADNALFCSTASLWEIAIKSMLRRPDFVIDMRAFRQALRNMAVDELPILGAHTQALLDLPELHRDPFDRLLVGQSVAESMTLWTNDRLVAQYSDSIRLIA